MHREISIFLIISISVLQLTQAATIKTKTNIENNEECVPSCQNGGICQMENCYCPYGYIGQQCQTLANTETRIPTIWFIFICIGAGIIGIAIVLLIKLLYDKIFGTDDAKYYVKRKEVWKQDGN